VHVFPDVMAGAVAWLTARCGVPVTASSRVAPSGQFIRVRQIGGRQGPEPLEAVVNLEVQACAPPGDIAGARLLSSRVDRAMSLLLADGPPGMPVDFAECTAMPIYDPEPDGSAERFHATWTLHLRALTA
jgi:hypothetical protein